MDNILMFLSSGLITVGFLFSFIKMIKNKNANGISAYSYSISAIAALFVILFAIDNNVVIIFLFEFILSVIGWCLIAYYHNKTQYQHKESKKDFIIPFLLSFIGIFGVSQTIKSYRGRKKHSNISILAYSSFALANIGAIYNAKSFIVLSVVVISTILFLYIIYQTYMCNIKYKKGD